mmetsp:Transcript_13569/g.25606  ORF Transcript_13569/g.25606 Transcript_13569/m.25606 type:complete len:324 (-) Transcript_13569:55-1026(-)
MLYCIRYHLGSIALSALCKLAFTLPAFLIKPYRNFLKKKQNHKGIRFVRHLLLITAYERFMKFLTRLSIVHQAVFAEKFWFSAKRSYFLINRNQQRAGIPQDAAGYALFFIKASIMLAGLTTGYCLLLFKEKTFTGQLTIELTSVLGPICFSGMGAWFIAEVFGGAFEVCCTSTLYAASCDEEMNVRVQRFAEDDLLEFMDMLGREQNAHERDAQGIKKAKVHYDDDSDEEEVFTKKPRKNQVVPLYGEPTLNPSKPIPDSPFSDNMFVHRPNIPNVRRNPNILAQSDSTWTSSGITSRPQTGMTDEEEPDSSRPMFRKAKFV